MGWGTYISARVQNLEVDLLALRPAARAHVAYVIAWAGLRDARILAQLPPISADLAPPDATLLPDAAVSPGGWNWWTGNRTEEAYAALHRADTAYLVLGPDDALQQRAAAMLSQLPSSGLPKNDPQLASFAKTLHKVAFPSGTTQQISSDVKSDLQGISRTLDLIGAGQHYKARSFRNMLLSVATGLLAIYLILAAIGWLDPPFLSLCAKATGAQPMTCPNGGTKPGAGDVFLLGIVGMAGGAIGALTMLLKVKVGGGPFTLPIAQALIKLPAGALVSLVGLFLLQNGTIGIFTPQAGDALVAWALVFGVAQQTITTTIDKKANDLAAGTTADTSAG